MDCLATLKRHQGNRKVRRILDASRFLKQHSQALLQCVDALLKHET